jgi:hypothetical protein
MKRKTLVMFLLLVPLALAAKSVKVQVQKARLLDKPDFLSSAVGEVRQSETLTVLDEKGSFYRVRTATGKTGFIHRSAVNYGGSALTGALPGQKGASEKEVALAAKGFSEANEQKIRGQKGYDFAAVDWVMGQTVSSDEIRRFAKDGELQ